MGGDNSSKVIELPNKNGTLNCWDLMTMVEYLKQSKTNKGSVVCPATSTSTPTKKCEQCKRKGAFQKPVRSDATSGGIAKVVKESTKCFAEDTPNDEWEAEFISRLTKKEIFRVILASNYMDVKSTLHLGCATIAVEIKGKSPDEIKAILGDNDERRRILTRLTSC